MNHRGHAMGTALIGLAVFGALALAAVAFRPGLIQGAFTADRTEVLPLSSERLEVLHGLAALIANSAEVLAIHQRGDRTGSPFIEIVLRLHNPRGSSFISAEEVAVISHSRVLQSIMLYQVNREGRDDAMLWTREEIADPEFCEKWRLDPDVQPRLIASGVSDLQAQFLHDRTGERVSMRLGLAWPTNSTEAEVEGSVILEVVSHERH